MCGLVDVSPADTHPAPGIIRSKLEWGPNALEGIVDETGIIGYSVYITSVCNRKLSEALVFVQSVGFKKQDCCPINTYAAELEVEMTDNSTNVTFMIVPHTDQGEFSYGAVTNLVVDWVDELAWKTMAPKAKSSDASRCGRLYFSFLLVNAACVLALRGAKLRA